MKSMKGLKNVKEKKGKKERQIFEKEDIESKATKKYNSKYQKNEEFRYVITHVHIHGYTSIQLACTNDTNINKSHYIYSCLTCEFTYVPQLYSHPF